MKSQMCFLSSVCVLASVFILVGCGGNLLLVPTPTSAPRPRETVLPTSMSTPAPTLTRTATLMPGVTLTNTPTLVGSVRLLFAYSPGCSHCEYQGPIIHEFETKHPEVAVTWVEVYELNEEQKGLVEGTSGHPVMVFHAEDRKRQIVGETPLAGLEGEYQAFQSQVSPKITTGSSKT